MKNSGICSGIGLVILIVLVVAGGGTTAARADGEATPPRDLSPALISNTNAVDVVYDFADFPLNVPQISVNRMGTGLVLFGRSDLTTDASNPDLAGLALLKAEERNPGLLEQFFQNIFQPTVTTDELGVIYANSKDLVRGATLKAKRTLEDSGIQKYLDDVVLPALADDVNTDASTLSGFEEAWYKKAEVCPGPVVWLRRTTCTPCPRPTDPDGPCGTQCMANCVDRGFTCVEWN